MNVKPKPGQKKVLVQKPSAFDKISTGLREAVDHAQGKPMPGMRIHHKPVSLAKASVMMGKMLVLPKPQKSVTKREADLVRREKARNRYREKAGVILDTCLDNLAQLTELAKVQVVTLPNNKSREWPVISATALGAPLNTTAVTMHRWLHKNMLPAPILRTTRGEVYHVEEARAILQVIGEHQMETKQYRETHVETKAKIFNAVARVRTTLLKLA